MDTRRSRASTSRGAGPVVPAITVPYFPAGLAKSTENNLDFNFTLFLFDSLRLPAGLFTEDGMSEVEFSNFQECKDYCLRYVAQREEWYRQQELSPDLSQERRSELSKDTMFLQVGTPLGDRLRYGNERFDSNLQRVRLDTFGNVMILNAPHWSDISAQFVHGFPRRLIPDHHRGMLSGNITVAARISNQAIRSMSTGN